MYCHVDFKTKEDLEKAVDRKKKVTVFQPKGVKRFTGKDAPASGVVTVMGPHTKFIGPESEWIKNHTWYAKVKIQNGVIKEVM